MKKYICIYGYFVISIFFWNKVIYNQKRRRRRKKNQGVVSAVQKKSKKLMGKINCIAMKN